MGVNDRWKSETGVKFTSIGVKCINELSADVLFLAKE